MSVDRDMAIAIAVAMGTEKAAAEANYDAAYPAPASPGADDVVGGGVEVRADGVYRITIYGDGRSVAVKQ